MKAKILGVLTCLGLQGCATGPLSDAEKQELETIQNYYFNEARTNAAFRTSCDAKEARVEILSAIPVRLHLKSAGWVVPETSQIQSLGVDICKRKFVYRVICSLDDTYPAVSPSKWMAEKPCKVILEGATEVQAALEGIDAEQKKKQDEAADVARQKTPKEAVNKRNK